MTDQEWVKLFHPNWAGLTVLFRRQLPNCSHYHKIHTFALAFLTHIILAYWTVHKQRQHFFWIFDTPFPLVSSFLVLSISNYDQFLTPPPSQLPMSFMDGPYRCCEVLSILAHFLLNWLIFWINLLIMDQSDTYLYYMMYYYLWWYGGGVKIAVYYLWDMK